MALIKIKTENYNENITYYMINKYISNTNLTENNYVINIDYKNRIRINTLYIPQYFNADIIFQSYTSFQQTNYILKSSIYKYICSFINNNRYKNILCIGGESFYYIPKNNYVVLHSFTNSQSIYNDYIFNCQFIYNTKNIFINLIDYNKYKFSNNITYSLCVLNLSTLPVNIIEQIDLGTIIIISCNHKDFWNKIKYFKFYKIISRKQFICNKTNMFITVNILVKKYVPLGYNCSLAYFLKNNNLRFNSYPFDWCQIKIKNIIECFKNNFASFTNFKISKFSENHQNFINSSNTNGSYILSNIYSNKITHEINNINELNNIIDKYNNRIYKLLHVNNPCFIIVINNKKDIKYIEILNNMLKHIYTSDANYQLKICCLKDSNEANEVFNWQHTLDLKTFFSYY